MASGLRFHTSKLFFLSTLNPPCSNPVMLFISFLPVTNPPQSPKLLLTPLLRTRLLLVTSQALSAHLPAPPASPLHQSSGGRRLFSPGTLAPFKITSEEPRVTIQVVGRPISFLLDTGASYSVLPNFSGKLYPSQISVGEWTVSSTGQKLLVHFFFFNLTTKIQ
jgi:hypothetical protein